MHAPPSRGLQNWKGLSIFVFISESEALSFDSLVHAGRISQSCAGGRGSRRHMARQSVRYFKASHVSYQLAKAKSHVDEGRALLSLSVCWARRGLPRP